VQSIEVLVAAIRVLSEPALLLFSNGQVVAANAPARATLGLDGEPPDGFNVLDLAASNRETFCTYMRFCGRSLSPMPGAFTTHRPPSAPVEYLCKGSTVARESEGARNVLLLRFWKRNEGNVFVLLNQKIAELTNEVLRRRATEGALRKSEGLLRERALEAENLNRLKDEFVAILSHELRTPLSAIIGWVSLLRQGRLTEDRRGRAIETIERNAKTQARLIEELLDISRIVTGKMRLNVQPIDPIRRLEASIDSLCPAAAAKGIDLHAILDPYAGPIMGDPDRLQQNPRARRRVAPPVFRPPGRA